MALSLKQLKKDSTVAFFVSALCTDRTFGANSCDRSVYRQTYIVCGYIDCTHILILILSQTLELDQFGVKPIRYCYQG